MKPYESFLSTKLDEYIAYRKKLGYCEGSLKSVLFHLDRYAKDKQAHWDSLQPSFFLGLRKELKGDPRTVNGVLTAVRGFLQFLIRLEILKKNPMLDVPALPERAYIPFIFAPTETEELLDSIRKRMRKNKKYFFKDLANYMVILLMARCGLRISEPFRLLLTHYRTDEGTICVEKTKFKKDRLIPAPKPVMAQIENYLSVRKSLGRPQESPYLFPGTKQKMGSPNQIYSVFHQAVKDIGLNQTKKIIADITFGLPRPHSLRHSFAINTLKHIKENGKSPQNALPILAAYMGHSKYKYTAVYLKVLDAEQRQYLVDFAISRQEDI